MLPSAVIASRVCVEGHVRGLHPREIDDAVVALARRRRRRADTRPQTWTCSLVGLLGVRVVPVLFVLALREELLRADRDALARRACRTCSRRRRSPCTPRSASGSQRMMPSGQFVMQCEQPVHASCGDPRSASRKPLRRVVGRCGCSATAAGASARRSAARRSPRTRVLRVIARHAPRRRSPLADRVAGRVQRLAIALEQQLRECGASCSMRRNDPDDVVRSAGRRSPRPSRRTPRRCRSRASGTGCRCRHRERSSRGRTDGSDARTPRACGAC